MPKLKLRYTKLDNDKGSVTMLKVFLVEDEFVVREGIKKNIDWASCGYEFCGEASDGELAFPMIQKEKPDIVITDIKMPFMDGLELSRLIKRELPWTEIIILTGFEEFEYAKEAISIGVAQYLSKPINGTELIEAVDAVAKKIEERRKERELREQYAKDMEENIQQEKKQLFSHLIIGEKSVIELIDIASRLQLDISAVWYNIILIKIQFQDYAPDQFSNHILKTEEILKRIVEEKGGLVFDRNLEGYAYLLKGDSKEHLQELQSEIVNDIKKILEKDERFHYFGGIGTPVNRLKELSISFESASHAFARRYFEKENAILDSAKLEDRAVVVKDEFNAHDIDPKNIGRGKIRAFLKFGNKEEAVYFVEEFFKGIGEQALSSNMFRQYVIMDAYFCIASFLEEIGIEREELEAFDANSQVLHTTEFGMQYVTRIVTKAIELREISANDRYKDIVNEVTSYIDKNYSQEDLSLNMLASHVNFSPNHLSMVFSQHTGQTLVKYVTDYRMNKAKELLRCTGKKSSEISMEVGYKDPHYFSYLFKKTQGMTPTQYRVGKGIQGED